MTANLKNQAHITKAANSIILWAHNTLAANRSYKMTAHIITTAWEQTRLVIFKHL